MKYKLITNDYKHITLNDEYVESVEYFGKDYFRDGLPRFQVKTITNTIYMIYVDDSIDKKYGSENLKFIYDWGFNK